MLGATALFGIIDGIAHYADQPDDGDSATRTEPTQVSLPPPGVTLTF
ncbi:MAG: hypothetical protein ABUL77_02550 [Bacteroidota bacterium]